MDKKAELLRIAAQLRDVAGQLARCVGVSEDYDEDEKKEDKPAKDPKMIAMLIKKKMGE